MKIIILILLTFLPFAAGMETSTLSVIPSNGWTKEQLTPVTIDDDATLVDQSFSESEQIRARTIVFAPTSINSESAKIYVTGYKVGIEKLNGTIKSEKMTNIRGLPTCILESSLYENSTNVVYILFTTEQSIFVSFQKNGNIENSNPAIDTYISSILFPPETEPGNLTLNGDDSAYFVIGHRIGTVLGYILIITIPLVVLYLMHKRSLKKYHNQSTATK